MHDFQERKPLSRKGLQGLDYNKLYYQKYLFVRFTTNKKRHTALKSRSIKMGFGTQL